jgi:hypothetical protein
MFGELRKHLNEFLVETVVILESNQRAVKAPGLRGDATQLRHAASQMLEMVQIIVEPYLRGALELALGDKKTAKQYLETEKAQEKNMEEVPQEVDEEQGNEEMVHEKATAQEEELTAEEEAIDEPSMLRETLPTTDGLGLDHSKAGIGMAAPAVTDTDEAVAQEDDIVPQGDGWDDF